MTQEKNLRIENHPSLRFDHGKRVTFFFENQKIKGYEGEPLGVALQAEGHRILSRSFKYHRPRGLYCLNGVCPNCTINVEGIPNVKACEELAMEGMVAKGQHCWPSLNTDFGSALENFDFLFPVGFQYKRFIRPRVLWPTIERIIRKTAGVGNLPRQQTENPPKEYEKFPLETEVLVLGGGPSGISAALEASRYGADVLLVDRNDRLGGNVRLQTHIFEDGGEYAGLRGFQIAEELSRLVASSERIRCLQSSTVFGYFEDDVIGILQRNNLFVCKAKSIIVATGAYEQPMIFRNNDLPGVFPSTGIQILMHKYGVKPGRKAVVVTRDDYGYILAKNLQEAGVFVAAIADCRTNHDVPDSKFQLEHGDDLLILRQHTIKAARGTKRVQRAILIPVLLDGQKDTMSPESVKAIDCDTICICGEFSPATEILAQADVPVHFLADGRGPIPEHDEYMRIRKGLYLAGSVAGARDMNESILQGRMAGLSSAVDMGLSGDQTQNSQSEIQNVLRELVHSNDAS